MPAKSPGNAARTVRKQKKSTAPEKKHTFESFTRRVGRLKIDPIHNITQKSSQISTSDLSHSHFHTSLEEWTQLNLSSTFTSLLNRIESLCETLPQLLHHADKIFDLLIEHIERRDALALEPLLDLTAQFAHDLGPQFEKYFARAVSTILSIASGHDAADVVEWCFTCLAWMFKFLSRLLVDDLRPLLHIFQPYLSARKEHVARFSAESLAFLIRKAAVLSQRRKGPLSLALKDLLEAAQSEDSIIAYGNVTLLIESALGIEGQLHSSATELIGCLLDCATSLGFSESVQIIVEQALVGLMHQVEADAFAPIVDVLLQHAKDVRAADGSSQTTLTLMTLEIIVGTRKGSRIQSWNKVLEAVMRFDKAGYPYTDPEESRRMVSIIASVLQHAPVDQILPRSESLLDICTECLSARQFFSLCAVLASQNQDRFRNLLKPRLQKFIMTRFGEDETALITLLESLQRLQAIGISWPRQNTINIPPQWETSMLDRLAHQSDLPTEDQLVALVLLERTTTFPTTDVNRIALMKSIEQWLARDLTHKILPTPTDLRRKLSVGWVSQTYAGLVEPPYTPVADLWEMIAEADAVCFQLVPFLTACNVLAERYPPTPQGTLSSRENAYRHLIQNLLSGSVPLRQQTLLLFSKFQGSMQSTWLSDTTEILITILGTVYNTSNARELAMHLRTLPQRQRSCPLDPWAGRLIPFFCLGLLSVYHGELRKDVCRVLAEIIPDSPLEDTILDLLGVWLRSPVLSAKESHNASADPNRSSPYECTNLIQLRDSCRSSLAMFAAPEDRLRLLAEEAHSLGAARSPTNARSLALEVLLAMPDLAEKRSRLIMPIFLDIPIGRISEHAPILSVSSDSSHTLSPESSDSNWSLQDRKSFLSLVGGFHNPRVLFRSDEIAEKLLELLANGNSEVRKLSLLAIFKWKDPTLIKHKELLEKIVEDKTANSEIGIVLNAESELNPITGEERITVLPVLLPLLYGQLVGRSGTHGSQEARRKSILRMLFRMAESEVIQFLNIMLGKLQDIQLASGVDLTSVVFKYPPMALDQIYGFLRLMLSLLDSLQSQFAPFGKHVVDALVYCTVWASHQLESGATNSVALLRNIRKAGLQCLVTLFQEETEIEWAHYMPLLFHKVVNPRLSCFDTENAQAVSTLLRLFSTWSQDALFVPFLSQYNDQLPGCLWNILTVPSAKSEVKAFVLKDILQPLLRLSHSNASQPNPAEIFVSSQCSAIAEAITQLLSTALPHDLIQATTSSILDLAKFVKSSTQSQSIIVLLLDILDNSKQRQSPLVKSSIVGATLSLLESEGNELDKAVQTRIYKIISRQFSFFKDSHSRSLLCRILEVLEKSDENLRGVTALCAGLNSSSSDKLEVADYDRRLQAYRNVDQLPLEGDLVKSWLPVTHSLLFSMADDDFSIRSNATSCLKSLVQRGSSNDHPFLQSLIRDVILPALQRGLSNDSEVLRADAIRLLGLVIQHLHDEKLTDMKGLLVGNDDEASFFNNVLHVQQHRRIRALARLQAEAESGKLHANNLVHIFLPILFKFIRDPSTDDSVQSTKGQSLIALKGLLQWIEWKHFKTVYRQYKVELNSEDERIQKTALKVLNQAADALNSSVGQSQQALGDSNIENMACLATTLPADLSLADEIKTKLLPGLSDFVHYKEETDMSSRLPAATIAVKLIKLLPAEQIPLLCAPIVLDVCNILKSRAQEARDAARSALNDIVRIMGPSSLQFVLRQMRTALTRGYQLHVLSFTMHSILVKLTPTLSLSELDYCLEDIVAVIMDDIFGLVGQEKDNSNYVTDMKEVKGSKSSDSMELIARSAGLDHLILLIRPIQTLLTGSLNVRQSRQADELLRRIGVGISHNPAAGERGFLVFAYQAIEEFYKEKKAAPARVLTHKEEERKRFLIDVRSNSKSAASKSSPLVYKIARFAIDLVRSALLKHNSLLTAENVHGFLPVVGDALLEGQEDVKTSAMRLLSAVIKLKMSQLDQNGTLYVAEACKVIKNVTTTNEESAQAALKLLAAILRDKKSIQVRDIDIATVLRRITPDLEEPDRQGVTFNFIKAVLARQYQSPEVYDLVDKIGIMMVTSHSRGARDVARGVYVHFLLEYPQSSQRWTKQQKFLTKNLEYDYPEGRESVMEAINLLLSKAKGNIIQQLVSTFFIPIVLRLANDDNIGCRDLASALLGQIFRSADPSHLKGLLEPLQSWLQQSENDSLTQLSLQAYNVLFANVGEGLDQEVSTVRSHVAATLKSAAAEDGDNDVSYQSLRVLHTLSQSRPQSISTPKSKELWPRIHALLRSREEKTQSLAASLVIDFFESCKASALSSLPLTNLHGLSWSEDQLTEILKSSMRIIKSPQPGDELRNTVISLLAILGRSAESTGMVVSIKSTDDNDIKNMSDGDDDENEDEANGSEDEAATSTIPAVQYILDQSSHILRQEVVRPWTVTYRPKTSVLALLLALIPHLSTSSLNQQTTSNLLLPLIHITDPGTTAPQSADPSFDATYASLVNSAQELLTLLQEQLGDQPYIQAMTTASKKVRERREERRKKRVIERVADPERAARNKKRKSEGKKERKKELNTQWGKKRKERGW